MAALNQCAGFRHDNACSETGGRRMAQYSGPSLAGLASPLEAFQPADIDDQLAGILGQIHEHQVPQSAADALDRLYGSLYASYRFQRLCDPSVLPHVWIGYQRGEIVGVLLFDIHSERVRVMTEMFALSEEVASAFCRDVFSRYHDVRHIDFNAIGLASRMSQLACQYFAFSENYILQAPASVEQYEQALGKSTRKTLRGYRNRLLREHPGFEWRCCTSDELPRHAQRALVRQLQEFKRASMAARGKRAEISRRETARMLKLASETGLIGIARFDGRIVGGSLACRVGDNYVMLLSAADPALESYRLGMLCCFWSVCDCIRVGARECHLLWGRYQYKTQLLGQARPLYRLTIYRSPLQMALSPASVMRMSWMSVRHRLRNWIVERTHERNDGLSQLLNGALQFVRASLARLQQLRGMN